MAWTKPTFYLSLIFLVIITYSSLGIVGTDLSESPRLNLNEKSLDYILEIKGASIDSGFQAVADTESSTSQLKGILDSEDNTQVSDDNDFLSTLFIKKERASAPTNLFKLVYNIPSTILISLRLPISDFKHITNIISYFLFTAILIMMWTKIIRS